MIGEWYAEVDPGDRYQFWFQLLGPIRNLSTGEVNLRLYCVEDAQEYLADPATFDTQFVWQAAHPTAAALNARREKWRSLCLPPAPTKAPTREAERPRPEASRSSMPF